MTNLKKDMTFAELLNSCPGCGEILLKHGLHCIGCHLSPMESIEDGCKAHGMSSSQISDLMTDLKKFEKENR